MVGKMSVGMLENWSNCSIEKRHISACGVVRLLLSRPCLATFPYLGIFASCSTQERAYKFSRNEGSVRDQIAKPSC
jgi:hypothetical protein